MNIQIQLNGTSLPIEYKDVVNTYTKGGMFCIMLAEYVHKFPLCQIFRVIEKRVTCAWAETPEV